MRIFDIESTEHPLSTGERHPNWTQTGTLSRISPSPHSYCSHSPLAPIVIKYGSQRFDTLCEIEAPGGPGASFQSRVTSALYNQCLLYGNARQASAKSAVHQNDSGKGMRLSVNSFVVRLVHTRQANNQH